MELVPDGVVLSSSWEDHGQGADIGARGTCHEALRPLKVSPEKIRLVMNDTAQVPNSGPSGGSRQQVMTGNAIKNGCEMLLNAMRKKDGTYRTYEEMKAEKIPYRPARTHAKSLIFKYGFATLTAHRRDSCTIVHAAHRMGGFQ